jgi:NhaA family Na+:H+ antiporter
MKNGVRPEKSATLRKHFKNAMTPFEEFIHQEASSGIILMLCALVAIIIANSPLFSSYDQFLHQYLVIGSEKWGLKYSVHHWINDGLMVFFFFLVGLEIKREILVGELADKRQAILPIAAAFGGMLIPALIYASLNKGEALNGWGIPMATDIAFALGIMALLGNRIPKALTGFLLAVAIVDDLGAVLIIAIFYTEQIHFGALLFAAFCFVFLILANWAGIRRPSVYGVVGIFLWLGMLKSGVHATLAGVLTALAVPARSACSPALFFHKMQELLTKFKQDCAPGMTIMENSKQQGNLQSMENAIHNMESPLQRMEHNLHTFVPFVIVPVFALANAGIPIDLKSIGTTLTQPVTIGVICGLILGKTIGIILASMLVLKLKLSSLPKDVTLSHLFGVSLLAAIGFTMSIFIGSLAFSDQPQFLLQAKIGIVFASCLAGIGGYLWLFILPGKSKIK